jgi:hypothetical protein
MSNKDMAVQLREWKRAADGTGFGSLLGIFDEAADEIERLRAERDEARQRLCKVVGDNRDMWGEEVAKEYGWDCFKEVQHD